jgi:hypothetical protein
MAPKAATPAKKKRGPAQLSDGHKAAMAQGRRESAAVGAYLEALEAFKPKRGRKRTSESIQKRIAAIDSTIDAADRLTALNFLQERENLVAELDAMDHKTDLSALEEGFVEVGAAYAARKGISYGVWREIGVPPVVLRRAGISR